MRGNASTAATVVLACAIAGGLALAPPPRARAMPEERTVPLLPGPGPQLRSRGRSADDVVRWNAECEGCHVDEANAWRSSRHHEAFTNAAFIAALGREPEETRAFCRGCHAPEAIERGAADAASAIGVGCVTCHAPLGPVLSSTHGAERPAPHGLVRTSALESVDACKRCHDFDFPRAVAGDAAMQRTIDEHRRSGTSLTCVSCHMRRSDRPSHAFAGGYDEALVREAIAVSVERSDARVTIRLAPERVTHAVPTGDLFRRLRVDVFAKDGSSAREVGHRFFARHFREAGDRRVEIDDDRLQLDPREAVFDLSARDAELALDWRVVYERVGFHVASGVDDDEDRAVVESSFVVASGSLGPAAR